MAEKIKRNHFDVAIKSSQSHQNGNKLLSSLDKTEEGKNTHNLKKLHLHKIYIYSLLLNKEIKKKVCIKRGAWIFCAINFQTLITKHADKRRKRGMYIKMK